MGPFSRARYDAFGRPLPTAAGQDPAAARGDFPTPADLVAWDDERYALWRRAQSRATWRAFLDSLSDDERELIGYRERRLARARESWVRRAAAAGPRAGRADVVFVVGMVMTLALLFFVQRWLRFGVW